MIITLDKLLELHERSIKSFDTFGWSYMAGKYRRNRLQKLFQGAKTRFENEKLIRIVERHQIITHCRSCNKSNYGPIEGPTVRQTRGFELFIDRRQDDKNGT